LREKDNQVRLSEKVKEVHELLIGEYGHHGWKAHRDALSELVRTILSQNTSDVNSNRAFSRLRDRFLDWEDVLSADVEEIVEAIRPGGLGRIKAPRIKGALEAILGERGDLDLSFLQELDVHEAKVWLESLDGVGPKTAACVLLFSLGRPVLPVDTHVLRVSRRVGLVEPGTSAEKAHEILGDMVSDGAVYDFHVNMVTHGRRVCHAQRPGCDDCVMARLCDYLHQGR